MSTTIYNSDNFDLSDWNLALPIDSSGGTSGNDAVTISNLTNFTSPYFYANLDGSMTFMAPVAGATTQSSYGTRSELRELNPDGTPAFWNLSQGGTMSATLEVNQLPTLLDGSQGKVIIGQIHGSSHELIRLYDDAGKIYFKNDNPASNYSSQTFQLTDAAGKHPVAALNQQFSYSIDAHGSTLTVKVYIGNDVYTSVTNINPEWQTDTLYFKAGVYNGDTAIPNVGLMQATGTGQTTFHGLDMSHTLGDGLGGLPLNAPVAQADDFTGQENTVITGNLLSDNGHGKDSGPAGDTLRIAASTIKTAHGGTVVENANGSFTYTPAAGFAGADSFTYTLKDGTGQTSTGTATIDVGCVSMKTPIAQADTFSGQENQAIRGNLMADNGHGTDTDPNGLALSVTSATLTTAHGGAVVENVDGTFTYMPAANFTGTDSFNYTLKDSAGLTSTGTANITVTASDPLQPPVTTGLTVEGTAGNDKLNADSKIGTTVNGNGGNDYIYGHDGNDILNGGDGNDNISGYWGNDTLSGGTGSDTLSGGPGASTFVFNAADLGTGTDKITDFSVSKGDKIDISNMLQGHYSTQVDLSNFVGITTSGSNNILSVDLDGSGTHWTQVAVITGVTGLNVQQLVSSGNLILPEPVVISSPPPSTGLVVQGTSNNDTLNADPKIGTTVYGQGGSDNISGHDGNDMLYGGDGNDKIYGYWGNDTLIGGAGSDTLAGGPGTDTFVFNAADLGSGADRITDFSVTQGDKIDISNILSGHYNAATNALADFVRITTSGSNSVLSVDTSGAAGAHGWTAVATIVNVTGLDTDVLAHSGILIV